MKSLNYPKSKLRVVAGQTAAQTQQAILADLQTFTQAAAPEDDSKVVVKNDKNTIFLNTYQKSNLMVHELNFRATVRLQ